MSQKHVETITFRLHSVVNKLQSVTTLQDITQEYALHLEPSSENRKCNVIKAKLTF